MWIKHLTFMETVSQNWSLPVEGYGMYAVANKLKRLRQCLREWNKTMFGNIFYKIAQAEELVRQKDILLEQVNTDEAREEWSRAHAGLLHTLAMEEVYWKQKA